MKTTTTKRTTKHKSRRKRGRPSLGHRVAFQIKLWPERAEALRGIAQGRGMTMQQMIAQAVEEWLIHQTMIRARRERVDGTAAEKVEGARRTHLDLGGATG